LIISSFLERGKDLFFTNFSKMEFLHKNPPIFEKNYLVHF
jgi:hypothetical protein